MKILNSKIHAVIDYIVVLFLLLSPTFFEMSSTIATLTYVLGIVHLLLTVCTDYEFGLLKVVPLKTHGWIELIVGIVLIASPLAIKGSNYNFVDKYFFALFGIAVLLTWAISDYDSKLEAVGT